MVSVFKHYQQFQLCLAIGQNLRTLWTYQGTEIIILFFQMPNFTCNQSSTVHLFYLDSFSIYFPFFRILNNDLASTVSKYPKRFVGLGTIPMQAPELAVEEMKRAAIDLKMPGFQIGSHVGDWNLDAKELYPIYKTAEELGETTSVSGSGGLFMKFYVKPKMILLL